MSVNLPPFIGDQEKLSGRWILLTATANHLDRLIEGLYGPTPNADQLSAARDQARLEIQNIERLLAMAYLASEKAKQEYVQGGAVLT